MLKTAGESLMKKLLLNPKTHKKFAGFTLIELIIVVATIMIVMTLAVPTYSNYSIRAKIGESLYSVTQLKSDADNFCQEGKLESMLNNQLVGYKIKESKYVQDMVLSGTCDEATIVILTQATGAKPAPVLTLTGHFSKDDEQFTWTCASSGLNVHAPKTCQS